MKIKFIKDFANNWKAGEIVKAKYIDQGAILVDDVAKIDLHLLLKHCVILSESEDAADFGGQGIKADSSGH